MTQLDNERRHFTRINFDASCRITSDSAETTPRHWNGSIIDLSLKGVLIDKPDDLDVSPGDQFKLELNIAGDEIIINMMAHVAHIEDNHIGFECEHIDLDSMTHLRRILELNLGDEHLLERELLEIINQRTH